jgi:phage tail-like protein
MVFSDFDSAGTYWFSLTLDGIEFQTVKKIDGLDLKLDKVETKSVNMKGQPVHKVWAANRVFLGEITATRVMTDDSAWADWWEKAKKDVKTARVNGSVIIYNQIGAPVRTYNIKNAWPTQIKVTGLDAGSNNPIEESVTFQYEELDYQKG